jgi:glycosyltransferase involved in cell wall biosynthesis
MHILHLVTSFQLRGAEVFARDLFVALQATGHSGVLLRIKDGPDQLEAVENLGGQTLGGPCGKNAIKELRRVIGEVSPDLVMAHGGQALKCAVLATRWKNVPVIYRKIGLTEQWLGPWRALKIPWQIDRFDVSSERVASLRLELGIQDRNPTLIAVGALSWEKNLGSMLLALKRVLVEHPQVVLLFAGDGPEKEGLSRLATELGVDDQVRFLGVRKDIPELMSLADVCLLTSLTEGVPGVLIEAGLSGTHCVTWFVAGAKEVVQDGVTGRVTPYKDESAFAEALMGLLADGELIQKMGSDARDFCLGKFDIRKSAEQHVEFFETLLNDRSLATGRHE